MMLDPSELPEELRRGHPQWALEEAAEIERQRRSTRLIRFVLGASLLAFALLIIAVFRWGWS